MWSRLLFLLIAGFFITMNVLLWRSEFGAGNELGSMVPTETVWHKLLIAPDTSHLEIRRHGKKIGYGNWAPSVGEDLANAKRSLDEILPEGMILEPSGYSLLFDGNFSVPDVGRIRFGFDLRLTTNHQWREFGLHLSVRPGRLQAADLSPAPMAWEIHALAAAETVKVTSDGDAGHSEQVFTFSELQQPEKLLQEAGLPITPGILAALGLSRNPAQASPALLGLKWEARNDWLKIATERMRVYRLYARFLDRFQIVLFISPEGEILRVELPDEIVLVNDKLTIL